MMDSETLCKVYRLTLRFAKFFAAGWITALVVTLAVFKVWSPTVTTLFVGLETVCGFGMLLIITAGVHNGADDILRARGVYCR